MIVELPHIISIGAWVVGLISLVVNVRNQARLRSGEFEKKLQQVCADVDVLKMQMGIFWKEVTITHAKVLHSPHTPDLDRLLEKYQEDRLDKDELLTLVGMLQEIQDNEHESTVRRKTASEFLIGIRMLFTWGMRFLGSPMPKLMPQESLTDIIQNHVEPGMTVKGPSIQEAPPTCKGGVCDEKKTS